MYLKNYNSLFLPPSPSLPFLPGFLCLFLHLYDCVTSNMKTTFKLKILRSIVTVWWKYQFDFVTFHLTCMCRGRGLLGRLTEIVKLQFCHKHVLRSCMLKDVHHHVLKRIVTGLHSNKMYRNASRKQISIALENLRNFPPVTCLVNDCHDWFSL